MSALRINFVPPYEEGLTSLHIEEATSLAGPFVERDVVTAIGSFPNYITEYTTVNAVNPTSGFFRLRWADAAGAFTSYSQAWRVGDTSVVGELIRRVRERDANINVDVIRQEAEAAVQYVRGTGVDPYDPSLNFNYIELRGMTNLILARSLMSETLRSSSGDVSTMQVGLVKISSGSSSQQQQNRNWDSLIELANRDLGINTSRVLQMEDILSTTLSFINVLEP